MTQQAVSDEKKLAIVAEIASIAGNPEVTFQAVEAHVHSLYFAAENAGDLSRRDILWDVWQQIHAQVQTLQAHGQHAIDIAVAVSETAAAMQQQRDLSNAELEKLSRAVTNADGSHPVVGALYNTLLDEAHEEIYEGLHIATECFACDVQQFYPEVDHDDLLTFIDLINGPDLAEGNPPTPEEAALHKEIGDFVTSVAVKWRALQADYAIKAGARRSMWRAAIDQNEDEEWEGDGDDDNDD